MTEKNSRKVLVVVPAANKVPLGEGGSHEVGIYLGEWVELTDATTTGLIGNAPAALGAEPIIDGQWL